MHTLAHIHVLSIWEVAHYWHGCDPRKGMTHQLPLQVRDTMLILTAWFCNNIAYRVDSDKPYLLPIIKNQPRFTARYHRHNFKKAIASKTFSKKIFNRVFIARSKLSQLCIQHNEPLPTFWFPDNYKFPFLTEGDTSKELAGNGRYILVPIYNDDRKTSEPEEMAQPTATVSSNAAKAAHAKHAEMNAIKAAFIIKVEHDTDALKNKTRAAGQFFDTLEAKQKYLFKDRDAAIRTLTAALREHLKTSAISN